MNYKTICQTDADFLFLPQEFSNYSFERFRDGTYYKQLQGNFLRLFYTHRLAGRD